MLYFLYFKRHHLIHQLVLLTLLLDQQYVFQVDIPVIIHTELAIQVIIHTGPRQLVILLEHHAPIIQLEPVLMSFFIKL